MLSFLLFCVYVLLLFKFLFCKWIKIHSYLAEFCSDILNISEDLTCRTKQQLDLNLSIALYTGYLRTRLQVQLSL